MREINPRGAINFLCLIYSLMRPKHITLLILTIAIISMCGKPDLSRSDAAKYILDSEEIKNLKTKIPLKPNGIEEGIKQGLWTITGNILT